MKNILLPFLLFFCFSAIAQTNVRAWYAQGQVWVVWQAALPFPETFAVFKKNTAFTNVGQATALGRLYNYEYLPGTFFEQTQNPDFTYKIPKPDGSTYVLAPGEGLFVETVTASGAAFYAVVEWGNTAVTAGVNITQNAVSYTYDPDNDPVNCHLQRTATLPTGHKTNWYGMWALGRQEQWAGRPDFPVMANAFKNGMPSMFIVSEAIGMDTSGGQKIPMTHWFHGGGMVANQFMASGFKVFNIEPQQGISVSHNDDFVYKTTTGGDTVFTSGRTMWFGWSKVHNPFNPGFDAGPGDTIINYTQRRILWINQWLIKQYNADPDRVALQGYSMGSAGASALGKAFPNQFSTVCAFNNGFRSGVDETSEHIAGTIAENLPTNLRRAPNDVVRMNEVFDLNSRTSPARDFPLFRTWAGKNDPNDRMHWSPDLVAQYRRADSLGWGAQISWDERQHVYETLGMHWIHDFAADQQTYRDNLSFQENFNSKQSFPAFFNHRLDELNNDPGTGIQGIDNGDGDNWGTWGGWHNWDLETLTDEPGKWEVTAWLTGNAAFPNDNCPENALLSDLAIRKPQQFKPATGTLLNWSVRDTGTGDVLQSGQVTVQDDDLVVIPQVVAYKENIRRVHIIITDPSVATTEPEAVVAEIKILPNPSVDHAVLVFDNQTDMHTATLRVMETSGKVFSISIPLTQGENRVLLSELGDLPAGIYFIEINADGQRKAVKWAKMR